GAGSSARSASTPPTRSAAPSPRPLSRPRRPGWPRGGPG
ncbi:MAG: hypothetical protein AVDCRST_MAG66-325, partial [uncultured Pseudonocardia sp.]